MLTDLISPVKENLLSNDSTGDEIRLRSLDAINDKSTDTFLEQVDEYTFKGYRASSGWAKTQLIYFVIKSSIPINDFSLYNDQSLLDGKSAKNTAVKGLISFASAPATTGVVRAASPARTPFISRMFRTGSRKRPSWSRWQPTRMNWMRSFSVERT